MDSGAASRSSAGLFAGVAVPGAGVEFAVGTGTGFGMYSGPFWPQPASAMAKITMPARGRLEMGFTFRITVRGKNALECSMTESEFLALAEQTMDGIEAALERAAEESDLDVECSRSGNVLEIEFIDNGSKIIINSQAPMQEMWIAARSGGFHYKRQGDRWVNTRDGSEFYVSLSRMVSEQGGVAVVLPAA